MTRRSFQKGTLVKRNGKWVGRWRERVSDENGFVWKHRAETFGYTRNISKGEAEAMLRERLGELNPLAQCPTRDNTFGQLAARYREESLPNRSLSTRNGYEKLLRKHLLPFFGQYNLRDINPALVQRFVHSRVKEDLTPQTVRNIYNCLRAIFKFGKKLRYLKENPADGVELPRRDTQQARVVLTPEQVTSVIRAFTNDQLSYAIVLCAYLTGLRHGEIAGLKWKDVDLLGCEIRPAQAVWNGKECGLKSRAAYKPLPLSPILREAFLVLRQNTQHVSDTDYVFATRSGKPLNLANWTRRRLKPIVRSMGLPEVSLHCLRHSLCTQLNDLGTDPKTLQAQARHADAETTLNRYTHQVPETQRKWVGKLDELLRQMLDKDVQTQLFSSVLN